ncbi:MAG: galactokinase [Gammaproteobacteria bacterium]|uniref:galactokinase n=1 Tax=Pseudomaricurvus alcaniphilus TaxID=1166482 RepID=UPI00140AC47D|nr:galactokinase [Pseudomaricurvus alcaniphilus]MBR9911533.1 galactokinase [Gammaproteobacteria bacterium]NHN35902.1 galactokinase [Pseudomaricurvus alcaniphilus]
MSTNNSLVRQVELALNESFGSSSATPRYFFSPARVNLIGEHIDYCGGLVMPAAIQFGTYILARPNAVGRVRMVSLNQPGTIEFDPNADAQRQNPPIWGDYVKGVFAEYRARGERLPALDIAIGGDIPGNGLSSSASLEVGIAVMIEALTGYQTSPERFANRQAISWLSQHAENHFVGVNCGIMDQGAIALGMDQRAMLMNCSDLSVDYVPVELGDYCLMIANSCKARMLADSAYNQRRAEVEQALELLAPVFHIDNLCQLPLASLQAALDLLPDPIIRRRTRHVVSEHHRVIDSGDKLAAADIAGFGQLLNQSHASLQQDYEVTGNELDTLVGLAQAQPGVLGARMTGAGFGGCSLVLLRQDAVTEFIERVGAGYRAAIGYDAEFYPVQIGPGAEEILSNTILPEAL